MDAAGSTSGRDRARAQASALAQQDQDRMRAMSPSALADLAGDTQAPRTVTLGKLQYSVTSHVEWKSDQSGGSVSCTGSSPPTYLQITSTVSGTPLTGLKDVTTDSLVAMPAGSTGGVLRVTIKDSQATPQPIDQVTVTAISAGGGVTPTSTNPSGCAVLTSLPNGTYTVKAQRAGYIDINGNDQPSVTAQRVFTAQTTDVAFTMERAGTLTAKFWTNANGWTQATSPAQRWDRITTLGAGITRKFGTPRQAGVVADARTSIVTRPGDTTPASAGLWPGSTAVTPGECAIEDYTLSPSPLYSASVPR